MAAYKYWRIDLGINEGNGYPLMCNVEMRGSVGGSDLCIGGIASARTIYPGLPASNAFNGNTGIIWSSNANAPQWLQYEFTAAVDIKEITLQAPVADNNWPAYMPITFDILTSVDGNTWNTRHTVLNQSSWSTLEIRAFIVPIEEDPDFIMDSGSFPFTGYSINFSNAGIFNFECESGHFPYDLQEAYIEWLNVQTERLAGKPIWHEGDYPPFEHVEGALPIDRVPPHWGATAPPPTKLINRGLLGNVIRNDNPGIANWRNPGIVAESPLLYFFGCDVTPKEIVINEVLVGDYFVPIQISNNHLGQSIEIRSLQILDDSLNTMEITPHNWPRMLDPYSIETYTLKISGTEGYPKIDSTLIVDAGTCYTEIPITGAREVECPECPPPCPPIIDGEPYCQLDQNLCDITRGDTFPFTFSFADEIGEPRNIVGTTLEFSMRLDIKQDTPDLEEIVIFQNTPEAIKGIGLMIISASKTAILIAGRIYCYKFRLIDGSDITTIGRGTIKVNPDSQYQELLIL